MALDESKYETMKFLRCRQCGNVYTARMGITDPECPECSSREVEIYIPEGSDGNQDSPPGGG